MIARDWFKVDKPRIHWMMDLHNMSLVFLGGLYPLLMAALVGALAFTGFPLTQLWRRMTSGNGPVIGQLPQRMLWRLDSPLGDCTLGCASAIALCDLPDSVPAPIQRMTIEQC